MTERKSPRTVILVPWRDGDELREQNWQWTKPYLEAFRWPIHRGDREGPWSRAAAINAAAQEAGDWDVAVVADADTVPEAKAVRSAVKLAARLGAGVRPHDQLYRLTMSGSLRLASDGPKALEERHYEAPPHGPTFPGGGLMVVSRKAWDAVGGYDERFVGWGHEDSAFGILLVAKASWTRIPGKAWHLWHPPANTRTLAYRRNRQLLQLVRREHAQTIKAAETEAGWRLGLVL